MTNEQYRFPLWGKLLHAGLAVFGISAYLTAELAEHASETSPGYLVHAYLGLTLLAVMLMRMIVGAGSNRVMRFRGWFPFSRQQLQLAVDDMQNLVQFRLPHRDIHQGLAALVQSAGLLIFLWMAITGAGLFVLANAQGFWFEALEEMHELGEGLVPAFLILHIGAVVLHTIAGEPVWQKMWKFGK
jgi:cytochrome b